MQRIGFQRAKITSATAIRPLAGRDALVPAARIIERQVGAADAGEDAAGRGRKQPDAVDRVAHRAWRRRRCRRRCGRCRPRRVSRNAQAMHDRDSDADEEQRIDLQSACAPAACRTSSRAGSPAVAARPAGCRACRRRRRGRCRTSIMAMPMAMSLTRGKLQSAAVDGAEHRAGDAGGEDADPGRAGEVGRRRSRPWRRARACLRGRD